MKKIFILLFLLPVMALLAGCQAARESQPGITLGEAARQAVQNPNALISYSADDLYDLTGIAPEDYEEAVFLKDQDTLSGREIIMVRAKDAQSIASITKALEQYLSQRRNETRDYLPEAYRLLCDARIQQSGLTVSLVVK